MNIEQFKHDINFAIEISDFDTAITLSKELAKQTPNDSSIYTLMSDLYLKMFDISSSISCLKKAALITKGSVPTINYQLNNELFCKGLLSLIDSNKIEYDLEFLAKMRNDIKKDDYRYLKAKAFLGLNYIKECINELNKILQTSPNNEYALILLGKVLINTGKVREGETLMWKAYEINPNNEEVKQFATVMKNKMSEILEDANANVLKGRLKIGVLLATKALKIYPNNPEALFLRSSIYKSLFMFNESISDLNLAKRNIHIVTGNGNEQHAMKVYIKECLSNIYNELSIQRMRENNIEEAMFYIEEALKNDKDDLTARLNKGDCYMNMKDIVNAKEEYLKCFKIDPLHETTRKRLAMVYYKLAVLSYNSKDFDEALEYLNKAFSYYDRADDVLALRARTFLKLSKVKQAYEDASLAFLINPNNQDAIEIKKFLS